MYGHNGPPADLGLPFNARNPDSPAWAAAKHAIGSVPPVRSRRRKGKLVRFRLKSGKRVFNPGPAPRSLIKDRDQIIRKAATIPATVTKAPTITGKKKRDPKAPPKYMPTDIRGQIAQRNSPAKRAKLRARR
jgi:hypothetical protein